MGRIYFDFAGRNYFSNSFLANFSTQDFQRVWHEATPVWSRPKMTFDNK